MINNDSKRVSMSVDECSALVLTSNVSNTLCNYIYGYEIFYSATDFAFYLTCFQLYVYYMCCNYAKCLLHARQVLVLLTVFSEICRN